ncbi:MAG: hypothetical protein GY815_04215 [Gammaproteobacteria bacterium]|nr:hypothetical protein [Gammaproteobacteria bacterium]
MTKPKKLGLGDKATISGDPNDMGLNMRKSTSNKTKLRGESGSQQPNLPKGTISSDRGNFKTTS